MIKVKAIRVIFVASATLVDSKSGINQPLKEKFICDFERTPTDEDLLKYANSIYVHRIFTKIVSRETQEIKLEMPFERFYMYANVVIVGGKKLKHC